jgi:hypothetical protein
VRRDNHPDTEWISSIYYIKTFFGTLRERRENTDMDSDSYVSTHCAYQETARPESLFLYFATDLFFHPFRKKPIRQGLFWILSTVSMM